ncbi:geraniol 8-hydroxylase-like [Pistacia vera]|uniref:geraniol 8-hydroxylase-like n=1 Tax=Pistacia vera TaxID=55513 RepID=UPI0012630DAB|nr:geraniol 8-hydroxylase-like [Pistacia vera]
MTELLQNPEALSNARLELEQAIDLAPNDSLFTSPESLDRRGNQWLQSPKDAQVLVNAWAISRDANTWENSNSFVQERFLGSDVDVKGRNFELILFGGERRISPGLPLAIRILHLMLGSLLHAFDWKLGDGVTIEKMDREDKFGLTLQKAQPLRAVPVACK